MQSAAYSSSHLARGWLSPSIASAFKADFTYVFTCYWGFQSSLVSRHAPATLSGRRRNTDMSFYTHLGTRLPRFSEKEIMARMVAENWVTRLLPYVHEMYRYFLSPARQRSLVYLSDLPSDEQWATSL